MARTQPERVALVWFRQDLRLADNPALTAAVAAAGFTEPATAASPSGVTWKIMNWSPLRAAIDRKPCDAPRSETAAPAEATC